MSSLHNKIIHSFDCVQLGGSLKKQALSLFNAACKTKTIYKPLLMNEFESIFYGGDEKTRFIVIGIEENKTLLGFACGNIAANGESAYITYVQRLNAQKKKGLGTQLLACLEMQLKKLEPSIKKYEIVFFNPSNLEWKIPHKKKVFHPNAPGVDIASDAYIFFKNNAYKDYAMQNCYYLNLKDYVLPQKIQAREKELKEKNLRIALYDSKNHYGFEELFHNLNNADWKEKITKNIKKPRGGDPVLIAEKNGKIVGFTGPMRVQDSGRGYFAGIGIHSDYRGGLGTVLFASLCKNLKEMGASYMTLFTGENNIARHIYENAGFKIVKTFANMRKELYSHV